MRIIRKQYIQKVEKLKSLTLPLQYPIEMHCMLHGKIETTVGEFISSFTMCSHCIGKGLDEWHRDFMVEPVIDALLEVYSDQ